MTMHLVKGMTTTRVAKSKRKITRNDYERYVEEHRAYNKRMKQQHRHSERLTLDQYIEYVHGKSPIRSKQVNKHYTTNEYQPSEKRYSRSTANIPSVDLRGNYVTKTEPMKYTGTLIKGIATMHKSNAVPVIDDQHAKDISKMRR